MSEDEKVTPETVAARRNSPEGKAARGLFDSLKNRRVSADQFADVLANLPSVADTHREYLAATNAGGVYVERDPLEGLGTCDHNDENGWPVLKGSGE